MSTPIWLSTSIPMRRGKVNAMSTPRQLVIRSWKSAFVCTLTVVKIYMRDFTIWRLKRKIRRLEKKGGVLTT